MSLAYDPMKWADNFNNSLEYLLEVGELDYEGVKELYNEGLITTEELKEAEEYLNAKCIKHNC